MNALFIYDHKFFKDNDGNYYSNGRLTYNILKRYLNYCNRLLVISRVTKCEKSLIDSRNISSGNNISFLTIPHFTFFHILTLFKKHRFIINREMMNSDFVITRLPSITGLIACNIAKKHNKKIIVEMVGCPWDALWNHSIKGKLAAPIIWYLTRKAIKQAPYVAYVTGEFLQKRYPTLGKQIANSDVKLQITDDSIISKRFEKIKSLDKSKTIKLCTIGSVDVRYKGQEYVIKAISNLNKEGCKFEYHIIGDGNQDYLQSVANRYNVSDVIKFVGSLPHEEIFNYLDSIDIYIQPSKQEGLPRAMIEAMSRGCPCIGSSIGGIPELIDRSMIFEKGNVKELTNILSHITIDKLLDESRRNFDRSKSFSESNIKKTKDAFFKEFLSGIKDA